MAAQQVVHPRVKRRGILAAAGAVVAGIVAKQRAHTVGATSGTGGDGALILGSNNANTVNSETKQTIVQRGASYSGGSLFAVEAISTTGNFTDDVNALFGHGTGQTGIGVEGF